MRRRVVFLLALVVLMTLSFMGVVMATPGSPAPNSGEVTLQFRHYSYPVTISVGFNIQSVWAGDVDCPVGMKVVAGSGYAEHANPSAPSSILASDHKTDVDSWYFSYNVYTGSFSDRFFLNSTVTCA